jgi:hypothetical protein
VCARVAQSVAPVVADLWVVSWVVQIIYETFAVSTDA